MGSFDLSDEYWREIQNAITKWENMRSEPKPNYYYSIDLVRDEIEPRKEKLSIKDRLDVLMCSINYALDVKNEQEFVKLSSEYNKLKLQLS